MARTVKPEEFAAKRNAILAAAQRLVFSKGYDQMSIKDVLDQARIAHQREVIEAARVWYTDGNAMVRQRVAEAVLTQRAPMLAAIVRQGVHEGVFTMSAPDQAAEAGFRTGFLLPLESRERLS